MLALSAACGVTNGAGSSPSRSELPSEAPSAAQPSSGELPSGAKLVTKLDVTKLPEEYPRKVWTEGNGTRIGLVAQEGGCSKASVEIAAQTDQQVALTMVESTPAKQQMCTMDIRYPSFIVTLNAPLGERTVVLDYQKRTY
ncbi:hypothetical protein EV192_112271 [Actinocrispum wychmicini]|uniref:Uncharacterized protein n=1 Tax=Actinocrispum wychmicini TaxID=1213861 RepID=A0A4R2J9G7_9PSEU|nr:hypothetical protein EV192_112271 [Actinocrispum wychmicini]